VPGTCRARGLGWVRVGGESVAEAPVFAQESV